MKEIIKMKNKPVIAQYANESGYISLHRSIFSSEIIKDGKLLSLAIYLAFKTNRTDRSNGSTTFKMGEIICGRNAASNFIDISPKEYRTRIDKLEKLGIVKKIVGTHKYTKYEWVPNCYISLNIPSEKIFTVSEKDQEEATHNNSIDTYINNRGIKCIKLYGKNYCLDQWAESFLLNFMKYKHITLTEIEMMELLPKVYKLKNTKRDVQAYINFMQWIDDYKDYDPYHWFKNWTIDTVYAKYPEYEARQLQGETWEEQYETLS